MAVNDIGRVTPIWRGFFSAATTYELNDIVIDTAGSVWWHKSKELTTGVIPEAGEIWDAVIDMSVFSGLIQAAITTAQTALAAAQEAVAEVTADTERAETAARNAEASALSASESAAGVGALAQAAEKAKNAAQTAASQAAASASSAGASATSAGSSAQAAETAKTGAETAQSAAEAALASTIAAKNAAITEIEEKGEEVLESIPDDYTALAGRVSTLEDEAETLAPRIPGTVSGDMAAFTDGSAGRPLSRLTVGITPGIGGSGEIGPGNPRPMTGYAAAKITRSGKNLFDKDRYTKLKVAATTPSDPGMSVSGTLIGVQSYAAWMPLPGGVTYAVTCSTRGSNTFRVMATGDYPASRKPYLKSVYAPEADTILFEAPAGTRWIGFVLFNSQSEGVSDIDAAVAGLQVEVASVSSAYEAFGGEHLDVAFPAEAGMVYAGTLDVLAGTLSVTHLYKQFDGTETWNLVTSVTYPYFTTPAGVAVLNSADGWCSHFGWKRIRGTNQNIGMDVINGTGGANIIFRPGGDIAQTVEDLTAWLADQADAGTPLQSVYPLNNPRTYTLTPAQMTTLLGVNRVWADCGTVDVGYTADTKTYIDNQIAALAALVLENSGD